MTSTRKATIAGSHPRKHPKKGTNKPTEPTQPRRRTRQTRESKERGRGHNGTNRRKKSPGPPRTEGAPQGKQHRRNGEETREREGEMITGEERDYQAEPLTMSPVESKEPSTGPGDRRKTARAFSLWRVQLMRCATFEADVTGVAAGRAAHGARLGGNPRDSFAQGGGPPSAARLQDERAEGSS